MAVDLLKSGQAVDLTKGRQGLTSITVGLSWGQLANAQEQKKGFFARLFDKMTDSMEYDDDDMDIDASVVMLTNGGQLYDTVYYGKQRSSCGSIIHAGDDRTGSDMKGAYDNEEIQINLSRVPFNVSRLVFVANVYQGLANKQHFGQVKGAYIRVMNGGNREEFIRYNLADDYNNMCGLVVGELYRSGNDWKFKALGKGTRNDSLQALVGTVAN